MRVNTAQAFPARGDHLVRSETASSRSRVLPEALGFVLGLVFMIFLLTGMAMPTVARDAGSISTLDPYEFPFDE